MLGVQDLLDVGSANGRGLKDFQKALPGGFVCGPEPVAAFDQQAHLSDDSAQLAMVQASGEALPFSDACFDVVCEFVILHHVPDPAKVLREMMRVSRRVLAVVDCNRFGQGPWPLRILRLVRYKLGCGEFSITSTLVGCATRSLKATVSCILTVFSILIISSRSGPTAYYSSLDKKLR
jgi:ubiquinone/menaquinone biosynthesis C-methylase UbiE